MEFQAYTDEFLARTLLPFIPRSVSPNQVSWLRIFSLPFIYYFLARGDYLVGFILFAVAALTDALDGAMARKRDQITEAGKVLDAVADRGLITLIALIFIPRYFGWPLFIALVILEIGNALAAYISKKRIGVNPGANAAGKIKMIVQCVAFGLIFIAVLFRIPSFVVYSYFLLLVSLLLTVVQTFSYPKRAVA